MATRKKKKTSKEAEEFMERIRNAGSSTESFQIVLDALESSVSAEDHKKIHRVHREKWFGFHIALKSLQRAQARVNRYLKIEQPTN